MQDRREEPQTVELLAIAGGLVVATLVFAVFYHLLGWIIHDKPLSFIGALLAALFGLLTTREQTLLHLKRSV